MSKNKSIIRSVVDGLANLATGMGVRGRDPAHEAVVGTPLIFEQQDALSLYRGGGIAARIVNLPAQDMTRAGFDIELGSLADGKEIGADEAQDISSKVMESWRSLHVLREVKRALRWEAMYGGAVVLMGIQDGLDPDKPVNEAEIKSVKFVRAIHRWRLTPSAIVDDVNNPRFGLPEFYSYESAKGGAQKIHHSRVLEFRGLVDLDELDAGDTNGWSDSIYTSVWDSYRLFEEGMRHAGALVYDFSQPVWKVANLANMIRAGKESEIQSRAEIMNYVASVLNARLIDKENEEWGRTTTDLGRLPDLLDRFGVYLAASLGWPLTLLLGLTPSGFTKNDETGQANWDDLVRGWQDERLVPELEKLTRVLMLVKGGPTSGRVADSFKLVPRPLTQMNEREKAENRKLVAEADAIYIDRDVLDPQTVATNRFRDEGWSMETQIDRDAEEDMRAAEGDPTLVEGVAPAAGENVAATALNGAQIASFLQLVSAVAEGNMPKATAIEFLQVAFPGSISEEKARKLLEPVEEPEEKPNPPTPPDPPPPPPVPPTPPEPSDPPPPPDDPGDLDPDERGEAA